MCKVMEDMINREVKEKQTELAFQMMKLGKITKDEAINIFELTEEEYAELLLKFKPSCLANPPKDGGLHRV